MSDTFTLVCNDCNNQLPQGHFGYLCPVCSSEQDEGTPPRGVFKTFYPYNLIREKYKNNLFEELKKSNFLDLLPLKSNACYSPLRVGNSPLYSFHYSTEKKESFTWYLKDDSQNPTFSFKDRASHLVSAYARENGIDTIVAASTGNAGSSLAGICASQNQKAVIIVPKSAPAAKLIQIIMYGAVPVLVDGNYDTAFELSIKASEEFGWFNRNTAFNPFTIEGKKTVAFEIYDQLKGDLPSRIFVPVGDGVILSGLYKGFEDLMNLGIISHIPVIVAVQSEKSDNLTRNILKKKFTMRPSTTIADSISVDIPRNFYMATDYLTRYQGEWITVSDEEIMEASFYMARNTGIFAEPAAAASLAGMIKYRTTLKDLPSGPMLILSTGSGLKDISNPLKYISLPKPIQPFIEELADYVQVKK